MFAKLLKHEFQATRGVVAILCAILLVSGLTMGLSLQRMISMAENDYMSVVVTNETAAEDAAMTISSEAPLLADILCVFLMIAAIVAISICAASAIFFLIYRFYKSRFTDEGYLTFTLPVTNHQLLLSSITNTTLNLLIVGVVTAVTVLLIFLLALSAVPDVAVWEELKQVWPEILAVLKQAAAEDAGLLALMAFSGVASFFRQIIQLMLAVTIGALIAKKHKLLAAVGVYYGIHMVVSFLTSMVSIYALNNNQPYVFMGIQGIVSAALVAGGYFLMHYLTSRKLNLT
ncbi:MAG: hypothetical protein U0L15_04025 [Oscillospiraceae bacterium]|nr:hypothetical protein [Oscillospiraceae bacterium]